MFNLKPQTECPFKLLPRNGSSNLFFILPVLKIRLRVAFIGEKRYRPVYRGELIDVNR